MPVDCHEAKASRNDPNKRVSGDLIRSIASLALAMTKIAHAKFSIVIASEHSERGNQQARNPRIMKDSMPFDCFALARNDR